MSARRQLPMRKIKEILRLILVAGLSHRQIRKSTKVARSTIAEYARKAEALALSWQQVENLSETELEQILFPLPEFKQTKQRPLPDWAEVDEELRRHRSLTLMLVWEEYRQTYPDGYSYSQFHFHFRRWKKKQGMVMRQSHRAGEKLFVDFCDGPFIIAADGSTIVTQIFVAVWGASNYTYAIATLSQDLPSWIGAHVSAFEYFNCVPHIVVPDNLKAAVHSACRYEPQLNPTYHDLACHYGTAVVPARPYKPRDKAKVEAGVLLVQRWILAALRRRTFYSLGQLNEAIRELLIRLNNKLLRKIKRSRSELFESLDRPAALALPSARYELAEWKKATVGPDYHIVADNHHYSVPYQLIGSTVEIRLTTNTVEVILKGKRVASHQRSFHRGATTTNPEHMPAAHRSYASVDFESLSLWAKQTGPATAALFEKIRIRHNGAPSALSAWRGIYRLAEAAGVDRIERAATRALAYGSCSYTSIKRILSANLDQIDINKNGSCQMIPLHENIRGSQYFNKENSI